MPTYDAEGFDAAAKSLAENVHELATVASTIGSLPCNGGLGEPVHLDPANALVHFASHYSTEVASTLVDVVKLKKIAEALVAGLQALDQNALR